MVLIKKDIVEETKTEICFEKIVDDLIMISITNELPFDSIPSYWRLTKVTGIPPLEIGIDCKSHCLASITFYLDSTMIVEWPEIKVDVANGNVVIDESPRFQHKNDFIDISGNYRICLQKNKLLCFFADSPEIKQAYRTDRIEVYVDMMNNIMGFAVCDLSVQEINMVKSI